MLKIIFTSCAIMMGLCLEPLQAHSVVATTIKAKPPSRYSMNKVDWTQLTQEQQHLVNAALEASDRSYSPYSGFKVGAALLTEDGTVITGTNQENASYGCAICAERVALTRANIEGHRTFKSVAIIAQGVDGKPTEDVTAPCGACRQMLFEAAQLGDKNMEVILCTTLKDRVILTSIDELLPMGFGPKDLGFNVANLR